MGPQSPSDGSEEQVFAQGSGGAVRLDDLAMDDQRY